MANRAPRSQLATHSVTNQPLPLEDVNLYAADPMLKGVCAWSGAGGYGERLTAFGARAGAAETQEWARQANRTPPILQPFDRYGQRIDEVEFHPAYHALMALGLEAGVSAAAWTAPKAGHALHAALMVLMGQADFGVTCPMSMTYASVPALNAEPALAGDWMPRITAAAYDPRAIPAAEKRGVTLGMAMTEKQGGSDVRANTTRAARDGGAYALTGHKWFCSAPMSDAFLTLAYADGGLTCFLVPRWRPDGERNAIELQRLKEKLGDRSNASAEIEYRGAFAQRVGQEGRGVRTILDMVQLTRFDCVIGAAAQMRQAGALAIWHAQHRMAFQRKLIDQPLMRAALADLALDVEAGLALAFRLGQALDRANDPHEAAHELALARVGLPLAKYWACKRAPMVVAEAMEALGGAGYIEDFPLARLFRQSPLNAIWEGSGNVIALDVLRALAREPGCRDALARELSAAGGVVAQEAQTLLAATVEEGAARHLTERLAMLLAASVLTTRGPSAAADGFITRRIVNRSLTLGAGEGAIDEAALLERLALAV
jgi:putative acyl-CoA dehydrogenase